MIWRLACILIATALVGTVSARDAAAEGGEIEYVIGVSPIMGTGKAASRWGYVAEYLTERVEGARFSVRPMKLDEVIPAARAGEIDMLIHQPLMTAWVMHGARGRLLATVQPLQAGEPVNRFGGVIFTRADHPGIERFEDLRGKRFLAVGELSFGGWLVARMALHERGIAEEDFASLEFTGLPQMRVVERVLSGEFDAGTVRTSMLEFMAEEGLISLDDVRVLEPLEEPGFPHSLSTNLYPEFSASAMPHLPDGLTKVIAAALLSMPPEHPAAVAAGIHGWSPAFDTYEVTELMKAFRMPPFDHMPGPTIREQLAKHPATPFALLGCFVAVVVIGVYLVRWNRRLHRVTRDLSALEQTQRIFVENTPAAVAMVDREMRYLVYSRGWVEEYGLGDEAIGGRSHYEVFPTIPERWKEIHRRCLAGERMSCDRDGFAREDGGTTWVRWSIEPWHDARGEIGGLIMFTQVINERVEHERAMEEALREAELSSRAKSQFLANMSHEIRTPMQAILGYADLLCGGAVGDSGETTEIARTIQANSSHLLTIINDILDVSKIEAGQMTVEIVSVRPHEVVSDMIAMVEPRARAKGLYIEARYDTALPREIESDPTRLRQILLNLIGNAVKFTELGGVRVRVSYDEVERLLVLKVVDTGIGMTAAQAERVAGFGAFVQADSSMTRRYGGTGLGLRISHSLAGLLGGDLSFSSTERVGTTFTVRIGIGEVDPVELIDARLAARGADTGARAAGVGARRESVGAGLPLDGVRVLLAEDGPDNQRLFRFHLTKAGADVTVGENGRVAVEAIIGADREGEPHLVLMDMQMPEMDGYEATRRLRTLGFGLPVIALTAHAMEGDREACLEAGCDDYATKPIGKADLVALCRRWYEISLEGEAAA